jgi:putative Mn2+ efflux pump MntP
MGTAIALGIDAFTVAAAVSVALPEVTVRHAFRLVWHFGLFQGLMTVGGWYGGKGIATLLMGYNHWIAFGLLLILGGKMIVESMGKDTRRHGFDPTRGLSLVVLSVATSIDALAVGMSLNLLGMPVVQPALVIGLVALIMTFVGIRLGKRGGELLGRRAEAVGGVVLIVIGVRILVEHG